MKESTTELEKIQGKVYTARDQVQPGYNREEGIYRGSSDKLRDGQHGPVAEAEVHCCALCIVHCATMEGTLACQLYASW